MRALALPLLAIAAAAASPPPGGTLVIEVGNVRNAHGRVHVDICSRAQFLGDCAFSAEVPAHVGVTEVVVHGLPAGEWAIQATHDENGNGRVDRALFGIPKEGVGFSRDARIALGPPKWENAVFAFDGRSGRQVLHLRYFLGPSGPPR